MNITVHPIGYVRSAERGPREDFWGQVSCEIELDRERFGADALLGLSDFSHVEVLFFFDRVDEKSLASGSRRPRGNPDWPETGIFAQRGKNRPNRLGATICQLLSVAGTIVKVKGLDALDGTPVLDIKPVIREFLPERPAVRQPEWASKLMADYFK